MTWKLNLEPVLQRLPMFPGLRTIELGPRRDTLLVYHVMLWRKVFAGDKGLLVIAGGLRRLKSLQITGSELYVKRPVHLVHIFIRKAVQL